MRFEIDKTNKNFVRSLFEHAKLKDEKDIYLAVGEIIKISQEWEKELRDLCKLSNCEIENLEIATLNKQIDILHNKQILDNEEYEKLKEIIKIRNYINHQFFLDEDWHYPLEEVEETLNSIFYIINEGRDCIANKIDKLTGKSFGQRPTILN